MKNYTIHATYDDEAKVYTVDCDEVAGLVVEEYTLEKALKSFLKLLPLFEEYKKAEPYIKRQ